MSAGRCVGDGHDRADLEVADRDPEAVKQADDPHAGGIRVERDLLGGLAQRGRRDVGVAGLGLAAREADLAAVVPVAARPLGQDDAGEPFVVRVEQHEHAGRSSRVAPRGAASGGHRSIPSRATGMRIAAGAGSGSGSVASRSRTRSNRTARRRPA